MKRVWEDYFEANWTIVGLHIAAVLACVAWALYVFGR